MSREREGRFVVRSVTGYSEGGSHTLASSFAVLDSAACFAIVQEFPITTGGRSRSQGDRNEERRAAAVAAAAGLNADPRYA